MTWEPKNKLDDEDVDVSDDDDKDKDDDKHGKHEKDSFPRAPLHLEIKILRPPARKGVKNLATLLTNCAYIFGT